MGHTLFQLRYQRDRLTALCCARSALNRCLMDHAGVGVYTGSMNQFATRVTCTTDSKHARLLHYVSTASWPSGGSSGLVSLHTGLMV